jgi:DUF3102 family protein
MSTEIVPFDYTTLDDDTRKFVEQQTKEIKTAVRIGARSLLAIGKRLAAVKAATPGHYLKWLAAEFEWSEDTAGRYIKLHEYFGAIPQIAESFNKTALRLLAGSDSSAAARAEAIQRAEQGEVITVSTAHAIIDSHLPDKAARALLAVPEADRPAVLALASKAAAVNEVPLDGLWITSAASTIQEIQATGDRETVEVIAAAAGYVDDGNGGQINAVAATTEQRAERLAILKQRFRKAKEKEQGLADATLHQGWGAVVSTDERRGFITIHAPELARDLGQGQKLYYLVYEKGADE